MAANITALMKERLYTKNCETNSLPAQHPNSHTNNFQYTMQYVDAASKVSGRALFGHAQTAFSCPHLF